MKLIDIAREFLQMVSDEVDPYTSDKGYIQQEGVERITLFTPSHIQFAKYGRGPGKNPPHDEILKWVKKEGILIEGTDKDGTAWAIANSIGKNGTQNYVRNAPNAMDEAITTHIDSYNKQLSNVLAVQVNDQLQESYREIFPEELDFKI